MAPALTLLQPSVGDESCYIDTPLGVAAVLRAVARSARPTSIYLDEAHPFIQTTLLGVAGKPPRLVFERSADEALNERVRTATELTFLTSDDNVPVQFSCSSPSTADYQRRPALSVALPRRVLRLQRRGAYRLPRQPHEGLVRCALTYHGEPDATVLQPTVVNLSCGGLAVVIPDAGVLLEEKTRAHCVVEIPGSGNIEVQVEVRAACEIDLPYAQGARRYGLEFVNMHARDAAVLQRYILEQQRARKKISE